MLRSCSVLHDVDYFHQEGDGSLMQTQAKLQLHSIDSAIPQAWTLSARALGLLIPYTVIGIVMLAFVAMPLLAGLGAFLLATALPELFRAHIIIGILASTGVLVLGLLCVGFTWLLWSVCIDEGRHRCDSRSAQATPGHDHNHTHLWPLPYREHELADYEPFMKIDPRYDYAPAPD